MLNVRSTKEVGNEFFGTIPVGIIVLSHSGTINSVNDRMLKMTGYSTFDLIHKTLDVLFSPSDDFRKLIEQLEGTVAYLSRRAEILRSNGAKVPVAISVSRRHINQTILCFIDLST